MSEFKINPVQDVEITQHKPHLIDADRVTIKIDNLDYFLYCFACSEKMKEADRLPYKILEELEIEIVGDMHGKSRVDDVYSSSYSKDGWKDCIFHFVRFEEMEDEDGAIVVVVLNFATTIS